MHAPARHSAASVLAVLVPSVLVAAHVARVALVGLAAPVAEPWTQTRVTTPKAHMGFNFGDDYQLANYTQIADYWRKLDGESDRLVVQEIGKTAE